jgi:predicted TIM-barrel fold metal-dependent hydrolase
VYHNVSVLDVHGHVSVPFSANSFLMLMMGANTPMASPIGQDLAGPAAVSKEDFHAAALGHVTYMDERNIDVQVIGPRPFLMLGWMEPHLLPAWTRYVNDMIHQQCTMFPDRFLGAAMLPQLSDAADLSNCVEELDRCVGEYGFAAAYLSPDPAGRRSTPGMHEPYWYPVYARAQELGIPLIVHGTNSLDPRYRVVPHNYQRGVPRMVFGTEAPGPAARSARKPAAPATTWCRSLALSTSSPRRTRSRCSTRPRPGWCRRWPSSANRRLGGTVEYNR